MTVRTWLRSLWPAKPPAAAIAEVDEPATIIERLEVRAIIRCTCGSRDRIVLKQLASIGYCRACGRQLTISTIDYRRRDPHAPPPPCVVRVGYIAAGAVRSQFREVQAAGSKS